MTQLGPTGEDESAGQTDTEMMRKMKEWGGGKQGKIQRRRGSGRRGCMRWLIRGALPDP